MSRRVLSLKQLSIGAMLLFALVLAIALLLTDHESTHSSTIGDRMNAGELDTLAAEAPTDSGSYIPRDDLFGVQPLRMEEWEGIMAWRLEVKTDPGNRPPPCQPFGHVDWPDGTPAPLARIEMLTNERTGGVGGSQWVDTGIRTDDLGNYELPPQEICPLRLAAETIEPHPGRGEEHDPPDGVDGSFRIRRDILLEEACSVVGEVRGVNGERLSAEVSADPSHYLGQLFRGDDNAYLARHPETRGRYFAYGTQSDEEGRFTFESLYSGDWTIYADAEEYRPAFVELSWGDGEACPGHLIVELQSDQCWSIYVFDERGQPIGNAYNKVVATMRTDGNSLSSGEVVYTNGEGIAEVCNTTPRGSFVESTAPGYTWEGARFREGEPYLEVTLHPAGIIEASLPSEVPDHAQARVFTTHALRGKDEGACLIRDHTLRCDLIPAGEVALLLKVQGFEDWTNTVWMHARQTTYLGELDLVRIPGEPYRWQMNIEPWSL